MHGSSDGSNPRNSDDHAIYILNRSPTQLQRRAARQQHHAVIFKPSDLFCDFLLASLGSSESVIRLALIVPTLGVCCDSAGRMTRRD